MRKKKMAQEKIKASEFRIRSILDTAYSAFIAMDSQGLVQEWNHQAKATFGWSREEVIGRPLADVIIPSKYREAHRQGIQRFLTTGEEAVFNKRLELTALNKAGHEFPVEITIWPIQEGNTYSFNAFIIDISERKNAEKEIKKLNQDLNLRATKLESANRELEAFSYSVSHDLRAPLRAIDGFSRIMVEEYGSRLDSECHRLLNVICTNTQRMGLLIDDLLAFSRISRQELVQSRIDMRFLALSSVEEMKKFEPERAVSVSTGSLAQAHGDGSMIKQVWVNLISNAFKFTHHVSAPRIEIGSISEKGQNVYWVKDNGAGFDTLYADKLFRVFQRLHTEEEFKGTGVGLALVHRIISKHGGRVWAEGKVNQGAAFYFTLPV